MFAIRILTGPQAGQIIPLKPGKNTLGRGSTCEVKIASSSVSKEHACVLVTEDKLILSDLNSRNGTFVNGVRIQNQRIDVGDKFGLHDVLFDILKVPAGATLLIPQFPGAQHAVAAPPPPAWASAAAVHLQPQVHHHQQAQMHAQYMDPHAELAHHAASDAQPQARMSAGSINELLRNFQLYIDNVAMPGVFALVKTIPFRAALAGLVAIYVVIVTALSVVPMMSVTKSAIKTESLRRAKTIARNLAATNRQAVVEKNDLAISTRSADIEEGVSASYIISARDGTIIAPTNRRGEYVNKPFVNEAWRRDRESEAVIDSSNLGVAVPITYYNAETGDQSIAAYSVVLYDMGSLAMSSIQGLSLFIETLALALLVGALLYFFLFKVVEQPLVALNADLDDALRDGRDDLRTEYRYSILEALASNINSALSRIGQAASDPMAMAPIVNRDHEAANIVRMLAIPALAVSAVDERVIITNQAFDKLIGGGLSLMGRPLTDIPDSALQANLTELLPRMRHSIGEIALSEIPFFGFTYEICGQTVMGASEPAYFLITMNKPGDGV